jgi:hypothetical protein
MTPKYILSQQKVLGSEIKELTQKIEPCLTGHTKAAVLITLVSIATLIQEPDLTQEQLQTIVSDVSKRIALLIDSVNPDADESIN